MKIIYLVVGIAFISWVNFASAGCTANPFSSPNDLLGQSFSCDDGSKATYHRDGIMEDYIEKDGERHNASIFTDVGDEYRGFNGRGFGDLKLERSGILGDRIDY